MYRHGECLECLDIALLRRVQIWPGVYSETETYHIDLCLSCRVNWRDDQYCSLAESFEFNKVARAKWRQGCP
jgi:hypothetical protein